MANHLYQLGRVCPIALQWWQRCCFFCLDFWLLPFLVLEFFVSLTNNVEIENNNVKTDLASENIDKGKSILEAPLKQDKKEVKNPRTKNANSQKPK